MHDLVHKHEYINYTHDLYTYKYNSIQACIVCLWKSVCTLSVTTNSNKWLLTVHDLFVQCLLIITWITIAANIYFKILASNTTKTY